MEKEQGSQKENKGRKRLNGMWKRKKRHEKNVEIEKER